MPQSTEQESLFPVVGIGASAGGLEAIGDLLAQTRRDDQMAYVIVQHLDPNHQSLLAELLGRKTRSPVSQVDGSETIEPGHVYVIPPGKNLRIEGNRLILEAFTQPRGLRRPIDDFFVSLAEQREINAVCVILSGTGADGTIGLRSIKEHGGISVVQSPETAGYDGMPTSAMATGLVDFICDTADIVPTLRRYFETRDTEGEEYRSGIDAYIGEVSKRLSEVTGHDFAGYKKTTVKRRIERRMQILNLPDPADYMSRVQADQDECAALFRDLLINVTRFFRDPEYFAALEQQVVVPLVAHADGEIRVWVPGCSSGEEAYSIAMLFADVIGKSKVSPHVRVFATDIDSAMLSVAREGRYPPASFADIPERMRAAYTVSDGHGFRVAPQIREMVRFSEHSVFKDAPFSRLDLVSCRNLLIYFEQKLQQIVLPIFHYALKPGGALFLGSSESVGRFEDLFDTIDRKARLFTCRDVDTKYLARVPFGGATRQGQLPARAAQLTAQDTVEWEGDTATRRLLEAYAPPSMVVDREGEIMVTNGQLGRFFEFRAGRYAPQFAPSLARRGLREVLTPLVKEATELRSRVVIRDIDVQSEFGTQRLDLYAEPLPDENILLVFKTGAPFVPSQDDDLVEYQPAHSQVEMLEDELRVTRYRLRGTVEELETANEELKSSNEEMMLMNEELQSTNEELTTVNDELKDKIDQLVVANADLRNFFDATQLAVIVLDSDLCVRSFTASAVNIFPLRDTDKGRKLSNVSSILLDASYLDDAESVLTGHETVVRQVTSFDGHNTWSMRVAPYRTSDDRIDGVTMTFNDVTADLALQSELESQQRRLQLALSVAGIGVWEYLVESGETLLDDNERILLGIGPDDSTHADAIIARIHPDDRPEVESRLRRAISGESEYHVLFRIHDADGELRFLRGLGRVIEGEVPTRMVGVNIDVTAEQTLKQARETMVRELNHRVKNLFAIVNGIIAVVARQVNDKDALADEVRARVGALAQAHSLTQTSDDIRPVKLRALVETAMQPYMGHHAIALDGDEVLVENKHITSLALILHEWATNAMKYGALRNGDGHLDISWYQQQTGNITLRWTETVQQEQANTPCGTGFGATLVDLSVQQLRGELVTDQDGLKRTMVLKFPGSMMG
ncbi:MAG: PAS domain-containing protein [Sphingomonadaceae bacterium]|nr:PAS domain-containing protein [Sphingomonadaceae bacterium]